MSSEYSVWQDIDNAELEVADQELARLRTKRRIAELERQVKMLSSEIESLRHELAQMREAVRALGT